MGAARGITRYSLGILALLSVVCIWVSSSFLMNNMFGEKNYNKPFFITYVNTASFSLYLLGPLFKQWVHKTKDVARRYTSSSKPRSISSYGSCDSSESLDTLASSESTLEQGSEISNPDDIPLTHREIAQISLTFCILWFAANWATNASLAYTTVASSTILSSMSGFFTLAIGAALKTESFSTLKLVAVMSSLFGVILVSKYDGDGGETTNDFQPSKAPRAPLLGDLLALMSALFYGCYTVLLKVKIQNENRINMSLFFGFVGLFNLILLWPIFGLLHWTGVEPFELPHSPEVIGMIVVNALLGTFVSDYLWLLSMLMTSPLVVTLGLSLTIPLALVGDVVGYGRVLGIGYWIGAGLVLAGFFGVNGATLMENEEKEKEKEEQGKEVDLEPSMAAAATLVTVAVPGERDPLLHKP